MTADYFSGLFSGVIIGFLLCMAMAFVIARLDIKKNIEEKQAQIADRVIIGRDGYIPCGKAGRK